LPAVEEARDHYEASMFTGDVVLLQSEEMVTSFVDPKMGWSNFVKGQILLYRIPSWHTDMFQDEGIIKRELALNVSLNTFLQILSVHSFEKIELFRAFQDVDTENPSPQSNNQLNLFDS